MASTLNSTYKLYYTDDKKNVKSYEERIHEIGEVCTAESLVQYLSHLRPLIIPGTDYHVFKSDIKPMWEDERNRAGGKFIIRTKRGMQTMAVFTSLVFAFCGGQFGVDLESELCGVVARARSGGFSVCLWHRSASDQHLRDLLNARLRDILQISDSSFFFEHETHDSSLSAAVAPLSS